MAHFRTLLEAEYRVEGERDVYKYIAPDGTETILVPAIMAEWTRAMVRKFLYYSF